MCTDAYRGRGVSLLMCTYARTDNFPFHVFVLRCLVLTFIKREVFLYIFESLQKKQALGFLKRILTQMFV